MRTCEVHDYIDIAQHIPDKPTATIAEIMLRGLANNWIVIANPGLITNTSGAWSPDLKAIRTRPIISRINTIYIEATNSVQPTERFSNKQKQVAVMGQEMAHKPDVLGILVSGNLKQHDVSLIQMFSLLSSGNLTADQFINQLTTLNPQSGNWTQYLSRTQI